MKKAATHLFKGQSENRAFFQNYRTFTLIEDPREDSRARQRSENPTPGATIMCESPGVAGRGEGGEGQTWNCLIHYEECINEQRGKTRQ